MRTPLRVVGLVVFGLVAAAPAAEPRWKLGFTHGPLEWVTMTDALGNSTVYHYMIYKVTNETKAARKLTLDIRLVTDVDRVVLEGYNPDAEARIEALHRKDLKNVQDLRGKELPDGESLEAVAIFREVPPTAHVLDVRIGGLTDLITRENGKVYAEKKVLSVKFARKGDEFERQYDLIRQVNEDWVVEGQRKEVKYR